MIANALPLNLAPNRYSKSPVKHTLTTGARKDWGAGFWDRGTGLGASRGGASSLVAVGRVFESWENAIVFFFFFLKGMKDGEMGRCGKGVELWIERENRFGMSY